METDGAFLEASVPASLEVHELPMYHDRTDDLLEVLRSIDNHLHALIPVSRLPRLEHLDLAAARRDYEQVMGRLEADPEPEVVEQPETMEDKLNADDKHDPFTIPEEIQRIMTLFDARVKRA